MKNKGNSRLKFWLSCCGGLLLSFQAVAADIKPHTWNLQNVPIQSVIEQVSKETGINFLVDPKVKGDISLVSSKELKGDELYQVFLSMLQVLGYAAIQDGSVTKIVPEASAKSMEIPLATDAEPGEGDEMVVRVVELQNVASPGLVPVLRSLVSNQGHLAAFSGSNVIVIADRARTVSRLVDVINSIDHADSGSVEHVTLKYASASELVNTLNSLYQARRGGEPGSNTLTLSADDRSNTILISGDKKSRMQLRALIAQLDVPPQGGGNTEVIYLRFQKAEDLVPVLGGLLQSYNGGGAAGQAGAAAVQTRANNAPSGHATSSMSNGGGLANATANPYGSNTIGQRSSTENRFSSNDNGGTPPSIMVGNNGVFAENNTNALVVTATPSLMRNLKSVIAKLDVRRAQVLVEAIIVEISTTTAQQLGIEWRTTGSIAGGTNLPVGTNTSGLLDLSTPNLGNAGLGEMISGGLTMGFIHHGSIRALLNAFTSDSNVNILSTPSLVALDNKEAQIKVGDSIPFPSAQYVNTTAATQSPITYYDYRDVGLALYIRPQITKGNAIQFDIEQIVDAIGPNSPSGPTTTNRELKTTVLINDGDILVLGGLIKTENDTGVSKVPFLGDIPLLGRLFKSTTDSVSKTNLMVFLRPVILRDGQDGLRVTGGKYDFMRDQEIMMRTGAANNVHEQPLLTSFMEEADLELPVPFA